MRHRISSGQISKYPLTEQGRLLERRMLNAMLFQTQTLESGCRVAWALFCAFLNVVGVKDLPVFLYSVAIEFRGFLLIEVDGPLHHLDRIFKFACKIMATICQGCDYQKLIEQLSNDDGARQAYLSLNRNEALLEYYRGWPIKTLDNEVVWADLRELHRIHGLAVARLYHKALKNYGKTQDAQTFKRKRTLIIDTLNAMLRLLVKGEDLQHLQTPLGVNQVFERVKVIMLVQYQAEHPGENIDISFETKWRRVWVEIYAFFIGEKLVSEPLYPILKGKIRGPVSRSAVPKDELDAIGTFGVLTPIPLSIQDEAAASRIYEQICTDLDLVKEACEEARENILEAHWNRIHLAEKGKVCSPNDSTETREKLENRCRTWQEYNYHVADQKNKSTLYSLRSAMDPELALLSNSTLLPFFYLLVAEHPAITASWLINYELYDKHGNLKGLQSDGTIAVSIKPRRGSKSAQQPIYLSEKGRLLLNEVLMLTQQARDYLRSTGNDDYRYLFLTANGFGEPRRKKQSVPPLNDLTYAQSILRAVLLNKLTHRSDRKDFFDRVTLKTMRTTAALKIYFETGRLRAMADALGHKTLNRKLLEEYLPAQLLRFFLNRWIRTFQTAITYKAVVGRPCLHEAMGLSNEHELQEFLLHHDLKPLPNYLMVGTYGLPEINVTKKRDNIQVVFPITPERCNFVLSCVAAVERLQASGHEVSEVGKHWWRTGKFLQMSSGLHESGQIRVCSNEVLSIFKTASHSEALVKVLAPIMTHSASR